MSDSGFNNSRAMKGCLRGAAGALPDRKLLADEIVKMIVERGASPAAVEKAKKQMNGMTYAALHFEYRTQRAIQDGRPAPTV